MPKLLALTLADDERQKLEAWARRPKTSQRLVCRGGAGVDPALLAPELRTGHTHQGEPIPPSPPAPNTPPAPKDDPHKGH